MTDARGILPAVAPIHIRRGNNETTRCGAERAAPGIVIEAVSEELAHLSTCAPCRGRGLTRKPLLGDRIRWPGNETVFRVIKTPEGEDNICWIRPESRDTPHANTSFIWRFAEGLNREATIIEAATV